MRSVEARGHEAVSERAEVDQEQPLAEHAGQQLLFSRLPESDPADKALARAGQGDRARERRRSPRPTPGPPCRRVNPTMAAAAQPSLAREDHADHFGFRREAGELDRRAPVERKHRHAPAGARDRDALAGRVEGDPGEAPGRFRQGPARLGRPSPEVPDEGPAATGLHQPLSIRGEDNRLRQPFRSPHPRAAVSERPESRFAHVPRGQPPAGRVEIGAVEEHSVRPPQLDRLHAGRILEVEDPGEGDAFGDSPRCQPAPPPVERQPGRARRPEHAKRPSRLRRPPDPDLALLVSGRDEPSVGRDGDVGVDRRVVAHAQRPAPVVEGAHEHPAALRVGQVVLAKVVAHASVHGTHEPRLAAALRNGVQGQATLLHCHDPYLAGPSRRTVTWCRPNPGVSRARGRRGRTMPASLRRARRRSRRRSIRRRA